MKTKKIRIKQGFTIVELVIVIGVIGVLSAVLIPTFINLNNKANEAADQSLIKNLNTQLRMSEAEEGKNKTLTDALKDAAKAGYLVENLTPKSGKDIVWNQETDEFAQLETAPAENAYKYWKIYEKAADIPATQTYSVFAKGTAWNTVPTLTVGFDAGENTKIQSLNFETGASRKVIIRTNGTGTSLTVNAPSAVVNHYDVLDGLTITAIAGESYHEWGTVNSKAVISSGHIAVEPGASVPEVSVEGASGDVKVTANEQTIVTIDEESKEGTKVVANTSGVFVEGAKPENVSGSKSGDVKTPALVTNETELRAAANGYARLGADITISNDSALNVTSKSVLDLNGHKITQGTEVADGTVLYHVAENANMTVRGEGTVTSHANAFRVDGSLRVDSGTFIASTVANSRADSCIIYTGEKSELSIFGGDFYSAKGCVETFGKVVINGGDFTSSASTKFTNTFSAAGISGGHSYAVTVNGESTINGGNFYGIHGALAHNGGKLVVNGGHFESNGSLAMNRYASKVSEVHVFGNREATQEITASTAFGTIYYALYAAGSNFSVTCTINDGEFINTGKYYPVLIGNSTYGDGGNRLPAFVSINGGKYVAKTNANILKVNAYVGTCKISGGNFNKGKILAGDSSINLADASVILADGCRVVENTDGTWDVVKA